MTDKNKSRIFVLTNWSCEVFSDRSSQTRINIERASQQTQEERIRKIQQQPRTIEETILLGKQAA